MCSLLGQVVPGGPQPYGLQAANMDVRDDCTGNALLSFKEAFACVSGSAQGGGASPVLAAGEEAEIELIPEASEAVSDGLEAEGPSVEDTVVDGEELAPAADGIAPRALEEPPEASQVVGWAGVVSPSSMGSGDASAQDVRSIVLQKAPSEEGRWFPGGSAAKWSDGMVPLGSAVQIPPVAVPSHSSDVELRHYNGASGAVEAAPDRLNLPSLVIPEHITAVISAGHVNVVKAADGEVHMLEQVQAPPRAGGGRVDLPLPVQGLQPHRSGVSKSLSLDGLLLEEGISTSTSTFSAPSAVAASWLSFSSTASMPVSMSSAQSALVVRKEKSIAGDSQSGFIGDPPGAGYLAAGPGAAPSDLGVGAPKGPTSLRGLNLAIVDLSRAVAEAGKSERNLAIATDALGEIRLRLAVEDGRIAVTFAAERHEGLDAVRRNLPVLTEGLREAGYREVAYNFEGHPGGMSGQTKGAHGTPAISGDDEDGAVNNTVRVLLQDGLDLRI